jgi:hypothetical protein
VSRAGDDDAGVAGIEGRRVTGAGDDAERGDERGGAI